MILETQLSKYSIKSSGKIEFKQFINKEVNDPNQEQKGITSICVVAYF